MTNTDRQITYSGSAELDIMLVAENYNYYLIKKIVTLGKESEVIVDFGAGNGFFANRIRQILKKNILCIEQDENLQEAISKYDDLSVENDLNNIRDNSVDFIYTLNVLEHITDDEFIISEFYKKLKKGGKLYVYVPAFPLLYSSNDLKVGHVRRYKIKDLRKKIIEKKFKLEKICYEDTLGFFVALLFKIIDRKKTGNINPFFLKLYDRFVFPLNFLIKPFFGKFVGKNIAVIAIKD